VRGRRGVGESRAGQLDFEFRVEASPGCFKYLGSASGEGQTASRFSRISAREEE
jgi:hypothetical protein